MNGKNWLRALLVASLFGIITSPAQADGTIKLGMIGEYPGPSRTMASRCTTA